MILSREEYAERIKYAFRNGNDVDEDVSDIAMEEDEKNDTITPIEDIINTNKNTSYTHITLNDEGNATKTNKINTFLGYVIAILTTLNIKPSDVLDKFDYMECEDGNLVVVWTETPKCITHMSVFNAVWKSDIGDKGTVKHYLYDDTGDGEFNEILSYIKLSKTNEQLEASL